jgi:spermidine synthase
MLAIASWPSPFAALDRPSSARHLRDDAGIAITGLGALTEVALVPTSLTSPAPSRRGAASPGGFRFAVYFGAFIVGAIVMSFEMLGSRYLNPYFGNGIYTWAALISTVLAALSAGYFLGGAIADRTPSATVLGAIVAAASLYLLALPIFAGAILGLISGLSDNVRLGSLCAALATMFLPVMLLGVYSPFAIRLVLRTAQQSGTVSGTVYGISTAGSIAGTLGTTFFLIPAIGTHAITVTLGVIGLGCALLLVALDRRQGSGKTVRSTAGLFVFALIMLAGGNARSEEPFDQNVRTEMLKHSDGRVAQLETDYNTLFIDKKGSWLGLSSMYPGRPNYIESIVDLTDPDVMPVPYDRTMTVALAYPDAAKRILMIGLGAGSISTYLAHAMPDAQIDVVELDSGVIGAGRRYFGLKDTDKVHLIESDGRVYLNRHGDRYDVILLDAFRELGVPFHMLTKEFYALVKAHLTPGGVVAANVVANTKLYLSTLATLGAVFPTVDVYPDWTDREAAQAVAVASPAVRPSTSTDTLMRRASALQQQFHFRYSLPALVGKQDTEPSIEGGEVLTDDFAPADLYRATPIR